METYHIQKNINAVCFTATSFPGGVEKAHAELHRLLPPANKRTCYGISYSDGKGRIVYKAAAEQLTHEEAEQYGLETFVIRKGEYMSELLLNYAEDLRVVEATFKKLLALPELDPMGYCLELYISNKDMRAMVPLKK